MPDDKRLLIDGGMGDDVVKRLKSIKAWGKTIDLVILTHPHIDHVRGLLYVLKGCPIREIWQTGVHDTIYNPWYDEWKTKVRALRVQDRRVKAQDRMSFGRATLRVLAPLTYLDGKQVSVVNNASIVTEITYGKFKALLMSDAQLEEQNEILSDLSHVQLFKVPHHGAKNAALEATYQKTKPDIAVVTVDKASSYIGLPDSYTKSLIRRYCKRNYATCRDGSVTISSDGQSYSIETKSE